jgi:hypothetical protein
VHLEKQKKKLFSINKMIIFNCLPNDLKNMNNFSINYRKIVETLRTIESKKNFLHQIRTPKLSDIELIAIDLTAEYMGIDSEYQLFRILTDSLFQRIERSVYNRRRRRLFSHRERIRKVMSEKITSDRDYYIVDSMPLEVCRLSRSSRCTICKENLQTFPDKGYCATQKMYYYGYELHCLIPKIGLQHLINKKSELLILGLIIVLF